MANLGTGCNAAIGAFTGVLASTKCTATPGLSTVWYAPISELNLTTMALPANFSTTNCGALTNFVMQAGGLFRQIANDGLTTTATRAWNGAQYVYTITLEYLGADCNRDCQLSTLRDLLCNAVFVIETNGCYTYMIGVKATISGGTATLTKDNATRAVTKDDLDFKTSTATDSASQIFEFTFTTAQKNICVSSATIPS